VAYMVWVIQVIIWWAGLMRGAVSIALAYNKVKSCVAFDVCFRFEMHDQVSGLGVVPYLSIC
jgi:hypothetical protein